MKFRAALCFGLIASATLLTGFAWEEPIKDWLEVGDLVYQLQPVYASLGRNVQSLKWSDDGRFLLLVNKENKSQPFEYSDEGNRAGVETIAIYDTQSDTLRQLVQSDRVVEMGWYHGSHVAFAQTSTIIKTEQGAISRYQIKNLDAESSQVESFVLGDGSKQFALTASPSGASLLAYTNFGSGISDKLWLCSPSQAREMTLSSRFTNGKPGWSSDGKTPMLTVMSRKRNDPIEFYSLNFEVDSVTQITGPAELLELKKFDTDESEIPTQLSLVCGATESQLGEHKEKRDALWLANSDPETPKQILIATEFANKDRNSDLFKNDEYGGYTAQIAPNNTAVAFISQGCAMIRPLVAIPKDEFFKKRKAAQRRQAERYAKVVSVGAQIYGADYDDVLPLPGAFDAVSPYIKDPGILDHFTPSYSFTNLENRNPHTTVLGVYVLPCGNAVVYFDGHVEWKDR